MWVLTRIWSLGIVSQRDRNTGLHSCEAGVQVRAGSMPVTIRGCTSALRGSWLFPSSGFVPSYKVILYGEPRTSGFTAVQTVILQTTLMKRDHCTSCPQAHPADLPFKAWLFFFFSMRRYQDPRDQQCLSSLRGLFWIRLWMWFSKQLPNRNWTRTPAPDEENALPLTTLVFAKGICPQTTRTWGKMGQKRISVYKIEASPHQHLTTYPVCFVQCD